MIPSIDDLSRRGFFIGENRRGHLQSRHMTLPFQAAMPGRSSPQDNQICCRDRLLEESSLPLLGDVIDLECCKEEGMLGMLVACTSTALVADLREDNQKEDPEEVIQKMQSYGPVRTLLPSYLPHGPEDPADPSTFVKSRHGWSIGVWAYPENAQEATLSSYSLSYHGSLFHFNLLRDIRHSICFHEGGNSRVFLTDLMAQPTRGCCFSCLFSSFLWLKALTDPTSPPTSCSATAVVT